MNVNIGDFEVFDEIQELTIDLNDFFTKEINKKEIIKKYANICHITIYSLNDSAYIYNLRKLPKLNSLNIGNVDNVLFFDELCNLKKLELLDMCNGFSPTLNNKIYMSGLSQCKSLRDLLLGTSLRYFPSELTRLKNLKSLYFGFQGSGVPGMKNITLKKISPKLCNLNKLNCLTLYAKKKYVIHKKKMLINDFCKKIKIPKKIKHLHIIGYKDEYINNLPNNIETLIISNVNNLPINNLPMNLKKIVIFNKQIEYLDNATGEYVTQDITVNDIKIPYGCELIIKED